MCMVSVIVISGLRRSETPLLLKLFYLPMLLRQVKVEFFPKCLPRNFMVEERRGKGQRTPVCGPWSVLIKWDDEIMLSVYTCLFIDIISSYKYRHLYLYHLATLL